MDKKDMIRHRQHRHRESETEKKRVVLGLHLTLSQTRSENKYSLDLHRANIILWVTGGRERKYTSCYKMIKTLKNNQRVKSENSPRPGRKACSSGRTRWCSPGILKQSLCQCLHVHHHHISQTLEKLFHLYLCRFIL